MAQTSREFFAKFQGKCGCCGMTIEKGTSVLYVNQVLQISDHYWGNEAGRSEAAAERRAFASDPDYRASQTGFVNWDETWV